MFAFLLIGVLICQSMIDVSALRSPSMIRSVANRKLFMSDSGVRTYSSFSVYKGKCALTVKVIPPTFSMISPTGRRVDRDGTMLFEFAPVGNAAREYDWNRKSTFSLSPTECGEFLAMDVSTGVDFFHDPKMGGNEAGNDIKRYRFRSL